MCTTFLSRYKIQAHLYRTQMWEKELKMLQHATRGVNRCCSVIARVDLLPKQNHHPIRDIHRPEILQNHWQVGEKNAASEFYA